MDVARFAEDNPTGEATNPAYRFAWRYRDWIIEAVNRDVPYLCSCQLRAWDYSDYSKKLAVVVWVAPQLARNPFVRTGARSAVIMAGDCLFGVAPCADQFSLPLQMAA
jgi:hypothetical protein